MRKIFNVIFSLFIVVFFMFAGALIYTRFMEKKSSTEMEYNSAFIQEQLKNVSKLVVTEATFSQILTYKDQQKYLMNLVSFDKKAVVLVNAKASVSYDMSQLKYQIDEKNKVIQLISIPEPEVQIHPDYTIYDVEQSTFNPFVGEDYNKINKKVRVDIEEKIKKSTLKANAENRFISELSKILILTNSLGWRLEYNGSVIQSEHDFITDFKL